MRKIVFILFLLPLSMVAQQENKASNEREARKLVREGNELYNQEKFADAEVKYKKALEKNPDYEIANYNLGNALSQQKRTKEAIAKYELVAKTTKDPYTLAQTMHNIGNAHYKDKNYQGAVEAYKNSLRANPKDDETRYNLALAQKMLKNQQNKDKKNKDKDKKDNKKNKDKDKKDKKDKKDDKKKDGDDKKKKDDKKDDKDKKKEGDDKKDKKDPNKDKKDDKQQQKPQPGKLSPQQVKQLLEAMKNEENKTQKKMNAKKERGRKIKQEKDW